MLAISAPACATRCAASAWLADGVAAAWALGEALLEGSALERNDDDGGSGVAAVGIVAAVRCRYSASRRCSTSSSGALTALRRTDCRRGIRQLTHDVWK